MNSLKKQIDMTLKDELPRLVCGEYTVLLEKGGEIVAEGIKRLSHSGNNAQLWMHLVKSDAIKNNTA